MAEKFVTMIKDGVTLKGVHPDAVPAHEAIGWVVLAEAEKSVEPETKAADNDTARKPAAAVKIASHAPAKKSAKSGKK
jgi:hypothetical protein